VLGTLAHRDACAESASTSSSIWKRSGPYVSKSTRPWGKLRAGCGAPTPSKTPGAPDLAGSETREHAQWIVHLGMTGQLLIGPPEAEMLKHTHAVLKLKSRTGAALRRHTRRFGRLAVVRIGSREQQTRFRRARRRAAGHLKIERFHPALPWHRKTPIKSALLNQKLLSGVGNIYADESLFRAKVRPRRRAASLTRAELEKLHKGLHGVPARGHQARRLVGQRLRRRRRPRRILPIETSRVRQRRKAMFGVRNAHQAGYHRRTQQSLLSALPEIKKAFSPRRHGDHGESRKKESHKKIREKVISKKALSKKVKRKS
jgi:hypothetical protein